MPNRTAFLLRLPASTREEATAIAKADGISLNHFISLALAEKLIRHDAEVDSRRTHLRNRPGFPVQPAAPIGIEAATQRRA